MWISRKKWEDMENKVDALADIHETQRDRLENGLIPYFPETAEYSFHHDLDQHIINLIINNTFLTTDTIPNLTLQELAQYVIDNKPIVREKNVKVKKVFR